MDFNFRNPRAFGNDRLRGRDNNDRLLAVPAFAGARGRGPLSVEEQEALKEQDHRRALALLEVARQQRSNPAADGGFSSSLGGSLGAGQIGDPSAADAGAPGLGAGKISNAGFASLQGNAPSVAGASNNGASIGLFGGEQASTPARGLQQRGLGGARQVIVRKSNRAKQVGVAAVESINQRSIDENREYCGTIERKVTTTVNDDGTTIENVIYFASRAVPGEKNKCRSPGRESTTVGRYHTHGDYSRTTKSGRIVRTTKNRDGFDSDNWNKDDRIVRNNLAGKTRSARRERDEKFTDVLATPSGRVRVKEVN